MRTDPRDESETAVNTGGGGSYSHMLSGVRQSAELSTTIAVLTDLNEVQYVVDRKLVRSAVCQKFLNVCRL